MPRPDVLEGRAGLACGLAFPAAPVLVAVASLVVVPRATLTSRVMEDALDFVLGQRASDHLEGLHVYVEVNRALLDVHSSGSNGMSVSPFSFTSQPPSSSTVAGS